MRKYQLATLIAIGVILMTAAIQAEEPSANGYRIEFNHSDPRAGREFPQGWSQKGSKWGVPPTQFYIKKEGQGNGVLVVESDKATGAIMYEVNRNVNLLKTPIMRWRWRVKTLPPGGDGRNPQKDDQALGVYVGSGSLIRKSIAYRWETDTPVGATGHIAYGSGLVKVAWFCVNNKETPTDKWRVEERNIAEDFIKIYGEIPEKFAVSISGNSQYTQSKSLAEIDYIEFLSPAESGHKMAAFNIGK